MSLSFVHILDTCMPHLFWYSTIKPQNSDSDYSKKAVKGPSQWTILVILFLKPHTPRIRIIPKKTALYIGTYILVIIF